MRTSSRAVARCGGADPGSESVRSADQRNHAGSERPSVGSTASTRRGGAKPGQPPRQADEEPPASLLPRILWPQPDHRVRSSTTVPARPTHRSRSTLIPLLANSVARRYSPRVPGAGAQARAQLLSRWQLRDLLYLANQVIGQGQAGHCGARFELAVQCFRNVTKLNHPRHVLNATCMCTTCQRWQACLQEAPPCADQTWVASPPNGMPVANSEGRLAVSRPERTAVQAPCPRLRRPG